MKEQHKSLLAALLVPVILLISFLVVLLIYRALNLPSAEEFLDIARHYYAQYGLWVVFLGAIAEGLLFVNWYLPGSAVGVLGIVFAKQNNQNVVLVVLILLLGFLVTSIINYLLGRYGWYRLFLKLGLEKPLEKSQEKLERIGLPLILVTYVHTNLGALTATGAGILRYNFWKFLLYLFAALAIWGTFWGTIVYYFGPEILELGTMRVLIITAAIWIAYLLIKYAYEHWQRRKTI